MTTENINKSSSALNEEEEAVLMDHAYDGIEEFNFALPNWWLITFWGGIIFATFYISYFIFMNGPSLKDEYYVDWKVARAKQVAYMKVLKQFDQAKYMEMRNDQNMVMYGKAVFEGNCQACHNKNAAGDIGPNLTDNHWIFVEGQSEEIFKFVISGSPSTGMPAWGPVLPKEDLYAVVAYIKSMNGYTHTNPKAKEPQGDEYPVSP